MIGQYVARAQVTIVMLLCVSMSLPAAAGVTLHFDLPTAPLGVFGVEFTADFLSPVSEIEGGVITSTRLHLEFNTAVPPNPFQNAATLAIQLQPPAGDLPFFTLTGADFGWSGTGTFIGDFETDALNLPIIDFPPGTDFALWFVRIINLDNTNPLLGGQLTNSYIEVDVTTIPAPAGLTFLCVGFLRRRRRRDG